MSDIERRAADLRRLATEGRENFDTVGDTQGATEYVEGLIRPVLTEALRHSSQSALDRHEVVESTGPVIHYTTVRAVVSMLQGKLLADPGASLRLYDSEHSNDPEEGRYFFRALDLPADLQWAAQPTPSHAYVTSFVIPSQDRDLSDDLPFWRTYGDDGQGCALSVAVPRSNLQKVLYGAHELKQLRAEVVPLLEAVAPIAQLTETITASMRAALWEALASIRYLYKDAAYDHERECRIVVPEEDTQEECIHFDYRVQTGHLRRYYEQSYLDVMELLPSGTSITIGPAAPHREDLRHSLDLMKRKLKLHGLEIRTSGITYRST